MSNEVAVRDVDGWAPMLPAVGDLAGKISGTNFVPKSLRGKPAEVAACILTGREIGIGPMESLSKIHVVDGRPTLSAELMRALVMRAGHAIRFTLLTDSKVTIAGKRAGEDSWTELTWTTADAQRIGVTGKDTWKKYPRQMLAARATSELCRLMFPDALGGVTLTPEEVDDENVPTVTITREAPTESAKVSRIKPKPAPVAVPEPPLPGEGAVNTETGEIVEAEIVAEPLDEPAPSEPGRISGPQTKMMGALMREVGITTREDALRYCAYVIGRDIESRNDLTKTEAGKVIDALTAPPAAQAAGEILDAEVVA